MRTLSALLLFLPLSFAVAENKPEPIRVCVSTLRNNSRLIVNPTWQQSQLIKAFERINKSKDVKKGKLAAVQAVKIEPEDPAIKDCPFVLHTTVTEVERVGVPQISIPPPSAIGLDTGPGDPRAYPSDYHSATVEYWIMRGGNIGSWDSGLVSAQDRLSEDTLVSQLMDQIASRVAAALRKPGAQPRN
jgi:hypothetical protein